MPAIGNLSFPRGSGKRNGVVVIPKPKTRCYLLDAIQGVCRENSDINHLPFSSKNPAQSHYPKARSSIINYGPAVRGDVLLLIAFPPNSGKSSLLRLHGGLVSVEMHVRLARACLDGIT